MDEVVEIDVGCVPELAVPAPILFAADERLVFTFNATRREPGGLRVDVGRAIVKVESCFLFKFGYPNDEALPGHPLYRHGFEGIAVYEVRQSSWIAEAARQNCIKFPESDPSRWRLRHFLFSFHESTLELLGSGMDVSISNEPLAEILHEMQDWLIEES
jgi:hypothetical protein